MQTNEFLSRQVAGMAEVQTDLEAQDTDLVRRRALWRALVGGPVIVTLSSTPAWASHYGYDGPPPGCDPPPKDDPLHDCNPND